ncbi:hypothetical protein SUGI_0204680 [Cryptomeria japonica]|nr:hypothetical protein SUGI_0204680 [Cryptomeria japonica]
MPICVENDSTTDLCAAIPVDRLDAFTRGESLREGVETQFLRKRHSEHNSALHNTHTTKMYSRYWCSYGPQDNKKKSPNKKHVRTYQKKRVSIVFMSRLRRAAIGGACCMGCDIKEQDRGYPGVVDGVAEMRKGKEA